MTYDHGTEEMYRRELRAGLDPCDLCKTGHARAIAEYRAAKPKRDRSAETHAATIRRRALNRLAEQYPGAFQRLLAEEAARTP